MDTPKKSPSEKTLEYVRSQAEVSVSYAKQNLKIHLTGILERCQEALVKLTQGQSPRREVASIDASASHIIGLVDRLITLEDVIENTSLE